MSGHEPSPVVTVGMPSYNGAPYVEAAVRSLLSQTHPSIQLMISDDGSTDGTRQIIGRIATEDPRITLLPPIGHLGMVGNFNRVLREGVKTGFFMWAAQDDLWEPGFVEEGLAQLEARRDAIGFLPTVDFEDERGATLHRAPLPRALTDDRRLERARAIGARRPWAAASAWNTMYGLLRTDRLPRGFCMPDVPGPDVPVAYELVLAGPFVTSDRQLATRRIVGYGRIERSDGSLVWEKALGPDGYLYSGATGPRCRAMHTHTMGADLSSVERAFLLGLIAWWRWDWWRARRVMMVLWPRAIRALNQRGWLFALAPGIQAACLAPVRFLKAVKDRL